MLSYPSATDLYRSLSLSLSLVDKHSGDVGISLERVKTSILLGLVKLLLAVKGVVWNTVLVGNRTSCREYSIRAYEYLACNWIRVFNYVLFN